MLTLNELFRPSRSQLLIGGSSVCDDFGCVSTGDEVMLTSPPELGFSQPQKLVS